MRYAPGEIIFLEGTGQFEPGIICVVLEVSPTGQIRKIKACNPDESLCKAGFLKEGDDYVAIEWEITLN